SAAGCRVPVLRWRIHVSAAATPWTSLHQRRRCLSRRQWACAIALQPRRSAALLVQPVTRRMLMWINKLAPCVVAVGLATSLAIAGCVADGQQPTVDEIQSDVTSCAGLNVQQCWQNRDHCIQIWKPACPDTEICGFDFVECVDMAH